MSPRSRPDRWRLHVALAVGLAICAVGFAVELHRGLGGHLPAWVYVAEWPVFAVIGATMWWRLLRMDDDEVREAGPAPRETPGSAAAVDDPGLAAWQAYVARLESEQVRDQH
jgi:hypothetical protein